MPTPTLKQQTQFVEVPIYNQLVPSEGPKCVPLTFDFSVAGSYSLDYQNMQARGFLSLVQCLFVDNSNNNAALLVLVNGTGQLLKVDAFTQGYYPVMVPSPIRLTFTTPINAALGGTTGTPLAVWMLNIPMAGSHWSVQGGAYIYGSGGVLIPSAVGNRVLTGGPITATDAGILTGNPGYYLSSIELFITPNATLAAAGIVTLLFQENTGAGTIPIWEVPVYLPAAPSGSTGAVQLSTPGGFFYNAQNTDSTLDLVLSANLTGGAVYFNLNYGLWSFVG